MNPQPDQSKKKDYRAVAKKLGVTYLFGKYGIDFLPKSPLGGTLKLFQVVKLDGWIFDPEEISRALIEDNLFPVREAKSRKVKLRK